MLADDPATPSNPGSIAPELKRRRLTLADLTAELGGDVQHAGDLS